MAETSDHPLPELISPLTSRMVNWLRPCPSCESTSAYLRIYLNTSDGLTFIWVLWFFMDFRYFLLSGFLEASDGFSIHLWISLDLLDFPWAFSLSLENSGFLVTSSEWLSDASGRVNFSPKRRLMRIDLSFPFIVCSRKFGLIWNSYRISVILHAIFHVIFSHFRQYTNFI